MSAAIVTWDREIRSLGEAVVAVGVFDGVHLGHQALLRDTVADARSRGASAVAVTFDRDPDTVVSPSTAAPQLLTLSDKLAAMSRTGVDAILVVPFTSQLAELSPESFLDDVLLCALKPLAVHVGADFRFGHKATGDVSTLQRFGAVHSFDVVPHDLVGIGGEPVTSTRIRRLIASGDIAQAAELLGGHPCVTGTVHRGRGEGADLGFPTANVMPVPFAALPGDGVYAGRAILEDGSIWPCAISVGTPPTFPQAKDYLEAHLIGFERDLYDQHITLEFWERLRDQRGFGSLDELTAAIRADVARAFEIAGFDGNERAGGAGESQHPTASHAAPSRAESPEWVPVTSRAFNILSASVQGYELAAPLEAARIPFAWYPYAPQDQPQALRGEWVREFTLLVPPACLEQAREELVRGGARAHEPEPELCEDDDACVFDPDALEAAERAVQHARAPQVVVHPGEDWIDVRSGMGLDRRLLVQIDHALAAAGIEHAWEPYSPENAPLIRIGLFNIVRFSVRVPESQADAADAVIREAEDAGADRL
jgi:riboflavin kinase/FMN adenylyltransferase